MPNNKGGKKYKRNKNVTQENKNTRFKDENESQEYAQVVNAKGNGRFVQRLGVCGSPDGERNS